MTKPWAFAYSDEEWDVIRRELPAGVATNEKRTDIERRVRRWLDEAASHFASLKKAEHKRPAAPHWSVYRGIARDLERVLPKVKATPEMARETDYLQDLATRAAMLADSARAYYRNRPRRSDPRRDWLLSMLMNIWRDCGGGMHASIRPSGRAGPLIRFLDAATRPVFAKHHMRPMTYEALRAAVRRIIRSKTRGGQSVASNDS